MALRGLCILIVMLTSTVGAAAGERGGLLHRASCSVVRFYVTKYGAATAETWARSKGASEAEIESARRCLKGTPVLTAQNARDER
jgi:hypothetical protein